jgi:uncharacterized YkwD family protein
MKKPFKVLATGTLLLMLAACNNNDNAAYDAMTPGDRNVTNVTHRGDNLGDAFRMRNGNDTAEGLDTTRNMGNRYDNDNNGFGFNNRNDDNNRFGFNNNRDDRDGLDFTMNNNDRDGLDIMNNDTNDGDRFDIMNDDNDRVGFNNNRRTGYNNRNNDMDLTRNGNDDTISADFTTINSGQFPHTKAVKIREAKYGYVVVNPQGKQITVPDIQSATEQLARRFQGQIAMQGGQWQRAGQQGQGGQAMQQGQAGQQAQQGQTGQQAQQPVQQPQPAQQAPKTTTQQGQQQQQQPAANQGQKAEATTPAKTAQPTQGISATEQKVIDLTNAERRKAGLKDLVGDTKLSSVARTKSTDMQKNGYFSHTSPTYGSPFDMMRDFGITYSTAGENIAQGQPTPEEVVRAWMNSEGHRKNILNGAFTHIGVGHDTNGHHWTQMFIGK